jgi:hypothetical protein
MDKEVISGIVQIFTILTPVALAVMAYLTIKQNAAIALNAEMANRNAAAASTAARMVERTLAATTVEVQAAQDDTRNQLAALTIVTDATHKLVNKEHGASLLLVAQLSKEKADRTKDPVDIDAAKRAERMLIEHDKQQAIVDAGPIVPTLPGRIDVVKG